MNVSEKSTSKLPCVRKEKMKHFKAFSGEGWRRERAAVGAEGECRVSVHMTTTLVLIVICFFSKSDINAFEITTCESPKANLQSRTSPSKTDAFRGISGRDGSVWFLWGKLSELCICMLCYWLNYWKTKEKLRDWLLLSACVYYIWRRCKAMTYELNVSGWKCFLFYRNHFHELDEDYTEMTLHSYDGTECHEKCEML